MVGWLVRKQVVINIEFYALKLENAFFLFFLKRGRSSQQWKDNLGFPGENVQITCIKPLLRLLTLLILTFNSRGRSDLEGVV